MAIGNQEVNGKNISESDLKSKYDDLIKEAIKKADDSLEVVRADDIAMPGTITTDIITRIMHSDYVVADVSYPNPNVFYELGLRHASRTGTIIIKDKDAPSTPFDIAHLRHIEYDNSASGLKKLSQNLKQYFGYFKNNPDSPDNQFLEHAKLTHYEFPNYSREDEKTPEEEIISAMFDSPEILEMFIEHQSGSKVDDAQIQMMRALFKNPEVGKPLMKALIKSENPISNRKGSIK